MHAMIPGNDPHPLTRGPARGRGLLLRALVVVVLAVAVRVWVLEVAIVEGDSMARTLRSGDRVLVLKPLRLRRFDVVVLTEPKAPHLTVIKRIVGLPGETVSMVPRTKQIGDRNVVTRDGQLYIDGRPYDEPYATTHVPTVIAPWKLRPGRYYVLGDNRDVSIDSRTYGGVPRNLIHGVACLIVWPLSRFRIIPRDATREPARGRERRLAGEL